MFPLSANVNELKQRTTTALETVTLDMLQCVREKLDYRRDVRRITGGAHIEHLRNLSWSSRAFVNFFFKFGGINHILVNIKPVLFHLI